MLAPCKEGIVLDPHETRSNSPDGSTFILDSSITHLIEILAQADNRPISSDGFVWWFNLKPLTDYLTE
jgi:hypothetical protein